MLKSDRKAERRVPKMVIGRRLEQMTKNAEKQTGRNKE